MARPGQSIEETLGEVWLGYRTLRSLITEALQDGPHVTDRDGYSHCWFCGGDGAWDVVDIEHEPDCVYVRIEAALQHHDGQGASDG